MRQLYLAVFLSAFHGALPIDQTYTRRLQESIQGIISVSTVASAPVLINLNCELGTSFLNQFVASLLSVELLDRLGRYLVQWTKMPLYAKVLMTRNSEDRFYLVLCCHWKGWNHARWLSAMDKVYESIWPMRLPSHSCALMWTTDSENFWDNSLNRIATSFTQIYATWSDRSDRMTLRTRDSDLEKWYSSYLQLHVNFEQNLETLKLKRLKFGRNSVSYLRNGRVIVKEPAGSVQYVRPSVELHGPQDRNISFVLELRDVPLSTFFDPWDWVWFSSYRAIVPVARVPPISKNKQIARTILHAEMWLPVMSIAFAAAVILRCAEEDFVTCFARLVLCVVHPVNIDRRAKSIHFFLIVGTWVLLIQVIKSLFQGTS